MKVGSKTVLVTGAAGALGRVAVRGLKAAGHEVWGLDLAACPACDRQFVGDLQDEDLVMAACDGVDVLVHLGAVPDDAPFISELMPANVGGLYQVLTAAQRQGVSRMVIASSGQVVWGTQQQGPWPISVDEPPRPRFWYAVTKELGEIAGRMFHREYGIDVLSVRLGACPRSPEHADEISRNEVHCDVYFSPRDAARFFASTVDADSGFGYQIVYACSRPVKRLRYDLEPLKSILGFEPQDQWPDHMGEYW
jgi:nucleoside-diphosphate-sugar epimerase